MDNMESRWHFIYWKYHKHTCFINFASSLTFYMFSFEYIYIFIYIYIKTLPTTLRFRPFFEKHASAHPLPAPAPASLPRSGNTIKNKNKTNIKTQLTGYLISPTTHLFPLSGQSRSRGVSSMITLNL